MPTKSVIERSPHSKITTTQKKKLSIRTEEDPDSAMAWVIAQRVRMAREKQGLRQEDLADRTGIMRPNITRLERGQHLPSLSTLLKVAHALNIDMNSLTAEIPLDEGDRRELLEMAEEGLQEWVSHLDNEDKKK